MRIPINTIHDIYQDIVKAKEEGSQITHVVLGDIDGTIIYGFEL